MLLYARWRIFEVQMFWYLFIFYSPAMNSSLIQILYRCSPRAPRLIRNRIVSSDPKARVTPSWIGGKTNAFRSKSTTNPSVAPFFSGSNPPGGSASYDSFYARFHRLQRILEDDSSSDNSSLLSNNSDEGSCSTDSTRDSTSTDDLSDYIFGDSGRGLYSPLEELLWLRHLFIIFFPSQGLKSICIIPI